MRILQSGLRLRRLLSTGAAAAVMLSAFAMVGGFGELPASTAEAAAATNITSISVSSTCGSNGGFTGTITLDGTFTGTITVAVFYHVPGGSQFVESNPPVTAVATFNNSNTATYNLAGFSFNGANSYRIQVVGQSDSLGGTTVKSASVPLCTGTTTTTTTTTTSTSTSTSTTTTATTTGTTT
jgi:hypothetical protein